MELETSNITKIYHSFDAKLYENPKLVERDSLDDNPNTEYLSDIMDEYEEFHEDFQ